MAFFARELEIFPHMLSKRKIYLEVDKLYKKTAPINGIIGRSKVFGFVWGEICFLALT